MKKATNFVIVLALITASLGCTTATLTQPGYDRPNSRSSVYTQSGYQQPGYDTYEGDFYDELSPYGQWVRTPEYGNAWVPNVDPGFQPYASNGHWVVTEFGNTWVSDYNWGWAPFHYGRWYQDRYRGWMWVPGRDWGPAWVSWRSGGGYYGWAPLGPGAYYTDNYNLPQNHWVFVPQQYVTSPRLSAYCVPRRQAVTVYQHTTIINNVYRSNNQTYAYGPRRDELERVTRRSVPVYRIENSGRPGRDVVRDNSVGIYRPNYSREGRSSTYPRTNSTSGRPGYDNGADYGGNRPADNEPANRYPGNRGANNRPDYRSRPGTYENNTPASPGAPGPQRNPSYPGNGTTYPRRNRYEPPAQAPATPQRNPESMPQAPGRLESVPQPDQPYRRGGGSYSPPVYSPPQPAGGQAREPRTTEATQNPSPQPFPPGGAERRSRGPR